MKNSILNIIGVIVTMSLIIAMTMMIIVQHATIKSYKTSSIPQTEAYSMTCVYTHSYASTVNYIFRDDNTGVLYTAMARGGITPMIDANGNIIVDKNFIESDAE